MSLSKILHYAVPAALVLAVLGYWLFKPPSLNPLTDPQAAEAMGRRGREGVLTRYLWSMEEKTLFRLYKELLA